MQQEWKGALRRCEKERNTNKNNNRQNDKIGSEDMKIIKTIKQLYNCTYQINMNTVARMGVFN